MKKKTKLLVISSLFAVTGIGLTVAAAGGFNDALGGVLPAKAGQHDSTHTLKEKAYIAPSYTSEGFKPYYLCQECCEYGPEEARYSYEDNTKQVSLSDIRMEPLTKATASDVAEGDMISTINTKKFKYVDQGQNGVDGKEGESIPLYVKDGGKTALFFSRSWKTGEPYNVTTSSADTNKDCSEFRFSVSGRSTISSVTFSYRYLDYGKGIWSAGDNVGQPLGAHSMVQFKDGTYYGKDVAFENDDQWHTITLNYADFETAGNKESTTNFTDLIFKFVDLRGHFYISDLSFAGAPVTVTLKNATADGTDLTENITTGSLPTTIPTMEGKTFAGWYDESGNKVEGVTGTTTLIARWKAEIGNYIGDTIYTFDVDNNELYGTPDGVEEKLNVRGKATILGDLNETWGYKDIYEDGSFVGVRSKNEFTGTVGVTFPAYDFSKNGPLTFDFGLSSGHDNNDNGQNSPFIVDGNDVGNDCDTKLGYKMTIHGQNASVYNKHLKKTYSFILNESVYKGEAGLSFVSKNTEFRFFLCTPYKSLLVDYVKLANEAEAQLPETPVTGDSYLDLVKGYQLLRNSFNEYENNAYPISEKMNAWIEATTPETVLKFEDHGSNLTVEGTAANLINKNGYDSVDKEKMTIQDAIVYRTEGNVSPTDLRAYVTLPKFDFSNYGRITFTMGFGGMGVGNRRGARVYLGGMEDSNLVGTSLAPNENDGYDDIEEFKITIQGTTASCYNGNETKSVTLTEQVINGTEGLKIGWGGVCEYSWFVISPFSGSQI